ncbi:Polyprenol monophosphomannose synthase [subsurface metagenome]
MEINRKADVYFSEETMFDLLNILIPVYNEAENIEKLFFEINRKVSTPHKIVIIYDSNKDNSLPVVRNIMREQNNIKLIKNKYGRGVLNAIKTGFEIINEGVILVVMADLSDDLSKIDSMFKKINEGYDIVCGSRYMRGGEQVGGPRIKKFLSRFAGISLHLLTGIPTHDVTNSFKMYKKSVLDNIEIESNGGFELGMEIVVKAFLKGYRITEVPSVWRDREKGKSRFRLWKWLPKYIYWYLVALINFKKKSKNLLG